MQGTVVGVLRGGPSSEHEVSLRSGHTILQNLSAPEFTGRDIFIDRSGAWYERGLRTSPERVLPSLDVAIVALHGAYGQDGQVQKVLERYGVPYTGADPFASHMSSHKVMAKERVRAAGLMTPKYRYIGDFASLEPIVLEITRTFAQPVIVKPVDGGSSVGVSLVGGYAQVYASARELFVQGVRGVLIEEWIRGTEATVGIIEGMRDEELYALPPVEIVPPIGSPFFSYEAKYSGESKELCPGRFPRTTSAALMDAARTAHETLGLRHYSRSDFIVSPKGIYFLETNNAAAVGMTSESLFPKSLAAVGITFPQFLTHLVGIAQLKR